jgi:hypothetical protein
MTPDTSSAIEHAVLAVTAARGGNRDAARAYLTTAKAHARATARRERQIVEVAALVVGGEGERAAGLALEHLAEFPSDAVLMEQVSARSAGLQPRSSGLPT